MDIEKLIEAVRLCGSTPKVDQCKQCAYWAGGDMSKCIPKMTAEAATALQYLREGADEVNTALREQLAENEKLRAENAEMEKQLNEFSEFLCRMTGNLLSKTNYTARAMIEAAENYQQRVCDDCDRVKVVANDELIDEYQAIQADLARVTAERDAAIKTAQKLDKIVGRVWGEEEDAYDDKSLLC